MSQPLPGLEDSHVPADVELHGVDEPERVRGLQQGRSGEGQERRRTIRIPHGVHNHRVR